MVLLKAALSTLPSARGPCYRAIMGSELAPATCNVGPVDVGDSNDIEFPQGWIVPCRLDIPIPWFFFWSRIGRRSDPMTRRRFWFVATKKTIHIHFLRQSEVSSLKHYSPGSIIRWPFGACGTLDFASAMTCLTQQLSAGESRGYRGVIFKVRRLLTAKEVDESNRQARSSF